jgi:hypothetical protein
MSDYGTLVIDRFNVRETPQCGTWLMCFRVFHPDGTEAEFHVPNYVYEGDGITIEALNHGKKRVELTDVTTGQKLKWWMGLDDDEADVCSDAEDQCRGDLLVKKKGYKSYHPQDDWDFSIEWHWEPD